ncbi:tripartite tricarboxylate transporter substrate binding protein [Streptomyces sp. PLAI1-29]|uniref:Tripartite tricarboxylate transporter substrate binding protein n=2 Tax=Streptomyces zingiberis TaxID=2053010 RepID=A0ABX1BZ15_9ACTN|nr:tripartite tricarboxylate transporter substrate binding protein [Streptomyces zingiberis]
MVPGPAGGGYDITARTLAVLLRETGLSPEAEVFNLAGSSGTVALTRLVHETGNERLLLMMGLGLVGRVLSEGAPYGVAEATPLARLIDEPETVVVRADSPYRTFGELVRAWRQGPEAATPSAGSGKSGDSGDSGDSGKSGKSGDSGSSGGLVAGVGSGRGGPDHLALMLIAETVGLAPADVAFDRFDGGGRLLAPVLDRRVDFALTGISEYRHAVAAGRLRVLAVTGPRRVSGVDAPTLREAGYPLEVVNWRGVLAPPGISRRDRAALVRMLDRLRATPQWRRALRENNWSDAFLTGDRFAAFLASEDRRVGAHLDRLGLGGRDQAPTGPRPGADGSGNPAVPSAARPGTGGGVPP